MNEYKRNPNTKCVVCSKPIYRRPFEMERNNGNVFCSNACYGFKCRKEKPCVICGKSILASAHKKTCSGACAKTHRAEIKYKINSPKDKVKSYQSLKIRLLNQKGRKCELCGYDKYEILQIHHKDRNNKNNEFNNLQLICPNCHCEEHYLGKSWLKKIK